MDPGREKEFIEEATRIVKLGGERGIILRLMGATAVRLHCPKFGYLFREMERSLTDLDFMSYGRCNRFMRKFFTELGYTPNERVIAFYGASRHIYHNEEKNWQADVFFDELNMCHKINFRNRLELDYPTITLADILLEKMQIVKINPKDVKDSIIMLREHEVGEIENETVNMRYIADLLASDWGFYYTVTTNLGKLKEFLDEFEALTDEDKKDVATKIDKLLEAIESKPKSLRWRMRAKIGTKRKWYQEVEEVSR